MEANKSYRIRTNVGGKDNVINIKMDQTYDTFEILSLKLTKENSYKLYESNYGVIVGRVLANGGFGIPNAKISIFIESDEKNISEKILYPYKEVTNSGYEGIRYNLLPDSSDDECHQVVGTFPNKRFVLDNNDVIEIFDKYWKYTTTSNKSGDYMLFGIPKGNQTIHVDIDLSDIGILSQKPRDMIYKGFNINQFENPNKFKSDKNLDSLAQIHSQNVGVFVYPYWGDTSDDENNIAISRCDIQVNYKFEPTCIFMGSIITDTGSNAIGKSCGPDKKLGKMSDMTTGEGSIEMIRKTPDGKVEELSIKGNRLIDGDGVWCYQIPMNLDYITTDEFGNIVPTDDPSKGIPTRTKVRFRVTIDETVNDNTGRKRCKYLIPNNPRVDRERFPVYSETKVPDYEFGTNTLDESYKELLWNNVYTVKNYIPNLQKTNSINNSKHVGIKWINHYGNNNPMPYNGLTIKLTFTYKILCVLTKIAIYMVAFLNTILSIIMYPFCELCRILRKLEKVPVIGQLVKPLRKFFCKLVVSCIRLSSDFCDDGVNKYTYYPGCGPNPFKCIWNETKNKHNKEQVNLNREERTIPLNKPLMFRGYNDSPLITCIENSLAQDNEVTSFNFSNDWINGTLYAPMWFRKITPKKKYLFGLIRKKAKDQWCTTDRIYETLRVFKGCAVTHDSNFMVKPQCGNSCGKNYKSIYVDKGLIKQKETMLGQTVYYYKPVEYNSSINNSTVLFATDIVLLGHLEENNSNGTPQFFKSLESSTYKLPYDILYTDDDVIYEQDDEGNISYTLQTNVEMTGCDWGNINKEQECGTAKDGDSGLFYGIGCSKIEMKEKSCINLSRLCEFGVSLDENKWVANLPMIETSEPEDKNAYGLLIPDGFVSYDELYNLDERSMFATMNSNNLKTELKENGMHEHVFNYTYVDNFDGSLKKLMRDRQIPCNDKYTYKHNYKLEEKSDDYIRFRYGDNKNKFYDPAFRTFPYYENSFYFYFGLISGKTAIEKFNSLFYSDCKNDSKPSYSLNKNYLGNSWCNDKTIFNEVTGVYENKRDGYIKLDFTGITTPYSIILNNVTESNNFPDIEFNDIDKEKLYIGISENIDDKLIFDGYYNLYNYINYENLPDNFENMFVKNNELSLNNGKYIIEIKDEEKNDNQISINYNYYYLRYNVEQKPFRLNNDDLYDKFSEFSSNKDEIYRLISIDRDGWSNESVDNKDTDIIEFNNREIGGMVIIYNLSYLNEPLTDDFKINIDVYDEEDLTEYEDYASEYKIINGVEYIDGVNTSEKNDSAFFGKVKYNMPVDENNDIIENKELYAYYFGVPKGGIDYKVTITYLCGDMDSDNMVIHSITVNEPIKYKMLINGIDYDIIKDFKTGWESDPNDLKNPNMSVKRINGWDMISEMSGLKTIKSDGVTNLPTYREMDFIVNKLIGNKDGFSYVGSAIPFKVTNDKETIINNFINEYKGDYKYYIIYNNVYYGRSGFEESKTTIQYKFRNNDENGTLFEIETNQTEQFIIYTTNDGLWRGKNNNINDYVSYTNKYNYGSAYNWPKELRYTPSELCNRYTNQGKYITDGNRIIYDDDWSITEFIPINQYKHIYIYSGKDGIPNPDGNPIYCNVYDKNYKRIENGSYYYLNFSDLNFEVEENFYYLKASIYNKSNKALIRNDKQEVIWEYKKITEDENLSLISEVNEVIKSRQDFITEVKKAFYITNNYDEYTLNITVLTDDYPIEYRLCYNNEIYNDCLDEKRIYEVCQYMKNTVFDLDNNNGRPSIRDDHERRLYIENNGDYIRNCEDDSYHIIEDSNFWVKTEEYLIDGIKIPTLIGNTNSLNATFYQTSETDNTGRQFGTGEISTEGGALVYHNKHTSIPGLRNSEYYSFSFPNSRIYNTKKYGYKMPYFIAVKNDWNKILPNTISLNDFKNRSYDYSFIKNNLFGIHFIDKSFNVATNIWAGVRNMPYFWPSGQVGKPDKKGRDGLFVNMNGIFACVISNGIIKEDDVNYSNFIEQKIGNDDMLIKTRSFHKYEVLKENGENKLDEYGFEILNDKPSIINTNASFNVNYPTIINEDGYATLRFVVGKNNNNNNNMKLNEYPYFEINRYYIDTWFKDGKNEYFTSYNDIVYKTISGICYTPLPNIEKGYYIPIEYKDSYYTIIDEKDIITDVIYGALKIVATGTIDHRVIKNDDGTFKYKSEFSVRSSNGSEKMTYYIYKWKLMPVNAEGKPQTNLDINLHPLYDVFPKKDDNGNIIGFYHDENVWHREIGMTYEDTYDKMYRYTLGRYNSHWAMQQYGLATEITSRIYNTEAKDDLDNNNSAGGEGMFINSRGWSINGIFNGFDTDELRESRIIEPDSYNVYKDVSYYVVGMTDNGNRAFSPVYDFRKLDAKIQLRKDNVFAEVKDNNSGCTNYIEITPTFKSKVKFNIGEINDNYYLITYDKDKQFLNAYPCANINNQLLLNGTEKYVRMSFLRNNKNVSYISFIDYDNKEDIVWNGSTDEYKDGYNIKRDDSILYRVGVSIRRLDFSYYLRNYYSTIKLRISLDNGKNIGCDSTLQLKIDNNSTVFDSVYVYYKIDEKDYKDIINILNGSEKKWGENYKYDNGYATRAENCIVEIIDITGLKHICDVVEISEL